MYTAQRPFFRAPHSENILFANSSSKSGSTTSQNLQYRAPKLADVDNISNLLVDCFESELKWFEFPEREARRKRYRDMLQKSFLRRMNDEGSTVSFMLMVEFPSEKNPVGFVQMGMLPPPPFFGDPSDDSEDKTKDVPYIANLCVAPSYRKSGIGKKMVEICIRWLEKRGNFVNVFIAVDADNFAAKCFYEGIDFVWIEPPEKNINPTRDYYYRPIIRKG